METGRRKFNLGLDFSGGTVERRKNGRFNRAGGEEIGGLRGRGVKGALASAVCQGPWAC